MSHALQPFSLTPELLRRPLPVDLYASNGALLSRRGQVLGGGKGSLLGQAGCWAYVDTPQADVEAVHELERLFALYADLMQEWACSRRDVLSLMQVADELLALCAAHADVCLCTAAYLPGPSHALRHSFRTAIVALLLGNALDLGAASARTLVRAALSMNLSLLAHHDDWARSTLPLSSAQRCNVQNHPALAADLLAQCTGVDLKWISAVDQHHENLDGSGYPLGLRGMEIGMEARVLRVADAWSAMTQHYLERARKTPWQALQILSGENRGAMDCRVLESLKNLMGAYPPGTCVRLRNREIALVTRWERKEAQPKNVLSVVSSAGKVMKSYHYRDTRERMFSILDYTHLNYAQLAGLAWPQVWNAV